MQAVPPMAEYLLVLLSLLLSPPPAEPVAGPRDGNPAIYAAIPADAWAAASFDLHHMRRDLNEWAGRLEKLPLPALAELPAPPTRMLADWQKERLPMVAAHFGVDPDRLRGAVDAVDRVHVVVHGYSGMGLGIGVIAEGVDGENLARLLAEVRAALKNEDAAKFQEIRFVEAQFDGRPLTLAGTPAGMLAIGRARTGDVAVLANNLALARTLLRGLDAGPAKGAADRRPGLDALLAEHKLPLPSAAEKSWVFLNLPRFLPLLGLGDVVMHAPEFRGRMGSFGPASLAEALFDLSSVGPLVIGETPDGQTVRLALTPESGWRRWLGGELRHDFFPAPADTTLFSAGLAFADAPALARHWSDLRRWAGEINRWPEDMDADQPWLEPIAAANAFEAVMGEPLSAVFARIRELGLRVAMPGAVPPEINPQVAAGLVAMNSAATLRFGAENDPAELWERLRRLPAIAKNIPELPAPDADGLRLLNLPPPIPDLALPIVVAVKGERLALALSADQAKAAVAVEPGEKSASFLRASFNGATAAALARAVSPELREAIPAEVVDLLKQPFTEAWSIDEAGFRGEYRGPLPAWVRIAVSSSVSLLPALERSRAQARVTMSSNNLKQIMLGILMWSNDHDDLLPAALPDLREYLPDEQVFICPLTEEPYQYVAGLAGVRMAKIRNPSRTVAVHSPAFPYQGGTARVVGFVDGHVETVRGEADFQERMRVTKETITEAGGDPEAAAEAQEIF